MKARTATRAGLPIYSGLLLLGIVLFAFMGGALRPFDAERVGVGPALAAPDSVHLMGTDELGRDVFNRVLSGTRVSLFVGITAALAAAFRAGKGAALVLSQKFLGAKAF